MAGYLFLLNHMFKDMKDPYLALLSLNSTLFNEMSHWLMIIFTKHKTLFCEMLDYGQ